MALTHKQKRRWALLILLIGLPVYIFVATTLVSLFERPNVLVEMGIYLVLGLLWALPFKTIFVGVGQADPDAPDDQ